MSYTHTTYIAARQALAQRLDDTGNAYWLDAENGLYIKEALRTFASFSAFWRERGTFNTSANTTFYDLPTNLPTQLGQTVTDSLLVQYIQYHLIENANTAPTGAAWVGTDMFTLTDVTNALERRRNQFLSDTGVVVTHSTTPMPPPPQGRVSLGDNVIDVRRAVFYDTTPTYSHLWHADEWELNAGALNWSVNPSTPYAYSILATPPLTLQVAPVPIVSGTLDLVTVNTGATLNPAVGVKLGVADNMSWIIKWGALADLLGMDGQARDPLRASFCEQRYQLGVKLARASGVIIQSEINGVPVLDDALEAIDALHPGWQGDAAAEPTDIGVAGLNLIALRPIPDGVYSVTMDVARSAIVPTNDGDFIQVGREQLDMILDYAEHLASFKMGGAEFSATQRQADNFMKQAVTYNERLAAASLFSTPSAGQSRAERERNIRRRQNADAIIETSEVGQ